MAKRDPNKTVRNKRVAEIKKQRRKLQPQVFRELSLIRNGKYSDEGSLNAFIGSKAGDYIELHDEIILTPLEYKSKWLSGLKSCCIDEESHHNEMYGLITGEYPSFKKYLSLFLESSFLKHYEEHYKSKPKLDESEYWFGLNYDDYGLLVTPRYTAGQWENDNSEIRHFKKPYWTIGHIMETGLCFMNEERIQNFSNVTDYLNFFRNLVRRTKSKYQLDIADRYINYVENSNDKMSVPLLIPELRYDPKKSKHEHRLDYFIVNPWTLEKYGFEFSPWSSHGRLEGAGRIMADYDRDSQKNFEKEMRKQKKYWRKYGVSYVIYTDEDLQCMDDIWSEIKSLLEEPREAEQLEFALLEEIELVG